MAIANALLAAVSSRPIAARPGSARPAPSPGRAARRGQDRHGDEPGGEDAGERVVLGGLVEGDEREADQDAATSASRTAFARRPTRGAAPARGGEDHAGQRGDHADPLQRARPLAVEMTPAATGTMAQVATIGATMLIVPMPERAVEGERRRPRRRGRRSAPGTNAPASSAVEEQDDRRARAGPPPGRRAATSTAGWRAARPAGEEVGGAPQQRGRAARPGRRSRAGRRPPPGLVGAPPRGGSGRGCVPCGVHELEREQLERDRAGEQRVAVAGRPSSVHRGHVSSAAAARTLSARASRSRRRRRVERGGR